MRFSILAVAFLAMVGVSLRAEELNEADKKKATTLITALGADDFQVRENAEKSLNGMGAAVLPLVKETAGSTTDAEVRTRCEHVIQALALDAESNPDELAKLAKTAAESKKFADASKFYAKAASIYKKQSGESADDKKKTELVAKATKATERQQRADAMAKNDGQDTAQVLVNGGARIRVIRAQGGVVMTTTGGADGSDW